MLGIEFEKKDMLTMMKLRGGVSMIPIESTITGKQYKLQYLEEKLKPKGYVIGGNWEYDRGSFDYKLSDENERYLYLRVPFVAVKGALDERGTEVELQQPYLLAHQYESGIDEHADHAGMLNQFQSPEDKDAHFPEEWIDKGVELVRELEQILQ